MTDLKEAERLEQREDALRVHAWMMDLIAKNMEATSQSGQAAIRTLFLLNGGALIALLTFLSAFISGPRYSGQLSLFVGPLETFAVGVAVAAASFCATYCSNFSGVMQGVTMKRAVDSPYLRETQLSKRWGITGGFALGVALSSAAGSLILFVWGFRQIRGALAGIS